MIRVLQVFARLTRGGLETFVMNVYRSIDREKIQFDFLLCGDGDDYEEEAEAMGARLYKLPPRNEGIRHYWQSLDKFFREHANEYAAIHMHVSSLSSIEPLEYAKKYGIKTRLIHSHSSAIKQNVKANKIHYLMHLWNKHRISRLATDWLGCSDKALDWLYGNTSVRKRAVMVNNGIDTSKYVFTPEIRKSIRKEFDLSDHTIVIGHVGSFIPVKNHKFILDVFNAFIHRFPNSKLLLVGDGELRTVIENEVNKSLKNKVIFTGLRSDVHELLQGMDILLMPSLFEGLPVSLVEAQATGLPLVLSDTISRDVKLTANVKFLSLSSPIENWVDAISQYIDYSMNRETSKIIEEKGFGIRGISARLTELYLKRI